MYSRSGSDKFQGKGLGGLVWLAMPRDKWGYVASLARVAKDPFPQLTTENLEKIKSFLTPTRCECWDIRGKLDIPGFFRMTSCELRAWGKQHRRPDLVLHAGCVEEREKTESCGDTCKAWDDEFGSRLGEELQAKVRDLWMYVYTGCWNALRPFPKGGFFAEFDRVETAVMAWRLLNRC